MDIHILTLFPAMFQGPFQESIIKRAIDNGLVRITITDIRSFTTDKHHIVDDYQYGGGPGMVMKPEPVFAAVESALAWVPEEARKDAPVVLTSPQGRLFTQEVAEAYARKPALVIVCGHYEGVDERVREHLSTDDVSIGDYVLTGGELPAAVIVDAVVRLLPGAVGNEESVSTDSITTGLLQHPLYTRPEEFRGWAVPPVLLSGNHAQVDKWRRQQALLRTLKRRPDLLRRAPLTREDLKFLANQGYKPE